MKPSTADENKAMTYEEKIQAVINDPVNCGLSPIAPVLAMFLQNFRPLTPPSHSEQNRNSKEIAIALKNLCEISINDISAVMLYLGFRMVPDPYGELMWAMKFVAESEKK